MFNPFTPVLPPFLETERLILRPPRAGDGEIMHAAIRDSFAHLHPFIEFAKTLPTPQDSETFVREAALRHHQLEEFVFMLIRKDDGAFLGNSGMHHINWDVPRFEIGYWLAAPYEGNGYMSEAVGALVTFALKELHAIRLEIRCDARNRRSAAVAERVGFSLEGRLRCEKRDNAGELADTLIYARLAGTCGA
ncbi:MAG: GNAT family protein [Chloroflexota bacterium]|nr:GNAT family protein [Chloroflexota bacterium]